MQRISRSRVPSPETPLRFFSAWQRLGDPSLTAFTRRELRSQMKQCSADLRSYLQKLEAPQSQPVRNRGPAFAKPDLRILT